MGLWGVLLKNVITNQFPLPIFPLPGHCKVSGLLLLLHVPTAILLPRLRLIAMDLDDSELKPLKPSQDKPFFFLCSFSQVSVEAAKTPNMFCLPQRQAALSPG